MSLALRAFATTDAGFDAELASVLAYRHVRHAGALQGEAEEKSEAA